MNAEANSLLLAFNGADTSLPALDYGVWLAGQIGVPVTLLGVIESPSRRKRVEGVIESVTGRLEAVGIPHHVQLVSGNCRRVICQQAVAGRHLAVFGPFDRPLLRRWLRGRSFRRILANIAAPVLYVKQVSSRPGKLLVCLGGLGYAKTAEDWALFLARRFDASVTFLHVVEPISYDYPIAQKIQDRWEDILETDTPQGYHLRQALKRAQEMGVPAVFQVCHGDVVHEIIGELNNQDYDLIVMGSPSSSANLRHLFMPNVTAEIAEHVDCPVLAAAFGQEWIFEP
ncbi:MAG: universal stress protein [Chloroflexi bacterium]|nr:universal stress protein [Chloroflexota bacterium]